MDFDLSEEQRLLQDSLARLLADRYGFEQRKEHMKSPEGWSREMWSSYAELGLLGLPFSEEEGGFGGGPQGGFGGGPQGGFGGPQGAPGGPRIVR